MTGVQTCALPIWPLVMDEVLGEERHQGAGHLSISGEPNFSMGLGYGNSIHAALAGANKNQGNGVPLGTILGRSDSHHLPSHCLSRGSPLDDRCKYGYF